MPRTADEDDKLVTLFFEGKEINELALIFDRKRGAIVSRLKFNGLLKQNGEKYTM